MKTPELILPAGDLNKTRYAFMYGADAVYGGLPAYSLRKAEVNFTLKTLGEAISYAHNLNKKFYVTLNIFPKNSQIKTLEKEVKKLADLNPDAFIISDPGLIALVKRLTKVPIHLSTQANSLNYETIRFWKDYGLKRVVLARELSLKEIAEIKKEVPEMELECFVHGAMCISYSGRCLLSNVMTGRASNQGICAQPCRWKYKLINNNQLTINNFSLEEKERPGEYFPIEEDETGTYIMNSKDLCMIEHLEELQNAGVDSFKIEGRNKSEYYVSIAARTYRSAIDIISNNQLPLRLRSGQAISNKRVELKKLKKEMESVMHREYTTGFFFGDAKKGEVYGKRAPVSTHEFLGVVKEISSSYSSSEAGRNREGKSPKRFSTRSNNNLYKIEIRNKIQMKDELEIITPEEIINVKVNSLLNDKKERVSSVSPGTKNPIAYILLPEVPIGSLVRKKV